MMFLKTRLSNLFQSKKLAALFATMLVIAVVFAIQSLFTGRNLLGVIVASNDWSFLQSRELIIFFERFFTFLGVVILICILILREKFILFLIPLMILVTMLASWVTLHSEACGIENHGWRTLRAARMAIVADGVVVAGFIFFLIYLNWKGWMKRKKGE